jgi:hypothetical protein
MAKILRANFFNDGQVGSVYAVTYKAVARALGLITGKQHPPEEDCFRLLVRCDNPSGDVAQCEAYIATRPRPMRRTTWHAPAWVCPGWQERPLEEVGRAVRAWEEARKK